MARDESFGSFPRMELGEALRNTDTQISNLKSLPLPRLTSVKKLFIYSLLHSTLYYIVPCDILHVEDGSPK